MAGSAMAGAGLAGPGAAPRWPVPEGLEGVDADDFALVAAAWMNGRTLEQLASDFAREPAEVKAGLRRGTRALVHAHGAATRSDPQDTPAADTGVAVPFAPTVAEDLEARRALELADVTALGVLSREDAAAVRAAVHERGTGETTLWRTRVQAAETAVTWALRGIQEEPPLGLLDDELLRRLPTQEEDLEELTDQAEASLAAVPAGRRRPRRRWTWLGVAVALIAVAAAIVVSVLSAPTDVQRVDAATDRVATREVQLNPGGRIQAVSSRQERLGYVQITDLPGTPAGTGYQVWLVSGEDDDAAAQRLGERRSAAEFDEPVPFSAFDDTSRILVTRETAAEPATPSDDVVASTPVRPSGGPTYGGMPTTPREDG
ncbi:MAG: anti-sigma factor [Micrococcus sp.]|nr:anti-sigma factor [Micrococcus sp.]